MCKDNNIFNLLYIMCVSKLQDHIVFFETNP